MALTQFPGSPQVCPPGAPAERRGGAAGGAPSPAGGPENMVLFGNGFQIWDYGIPRDPNGLYGTQEAFGKASFPQTLLKNGSPRLFPISGNLGRVPQAPCVSPMGLLWAYRGLFPLFGVRRQDHFESFLSGHLPLALSVPKLPSKPS